MTDVGFYARLSNLAYCAGRVCDNLLNDDRLEEDFDCIACKELRGEYGANLRFREAKCGSDGPDEWELGLYAAWDESRRTAIIAFQGTSDTKENYDMNLAFNLDPFAVEYPGVTFRGEPVLVARGYYRAFEGVGTDGKKFNNKSLREEMERMVERLRPEDGEPCANLVLVGHSLGGAMATMGAYQLMQGWTRGWNNYCAEGRAVVTFADVRFASERLAEHYDDLARHFGFKHFRFTNRGDIVQSIPVSWGTRVSSVEITECDCEEFGCDPHNGAPTPLPRAPRERTARPPHLRCHDAGPRPRSPRAPARVLLPLCERPGRRTVFACVGQETVGHTQRECRRRQHYGQPRTPPPSSPKGVEGGEIRSGCLEGPTRSRGL